MSQTTTIRMKAAEKQALQRAARLRGKSLTRFLIESAKEAAQSSARFAFLDYPDEVALSHQAEQDPRAYIRRKIHARNR